MGVADMITLYPFQETGRDFLAARENAILADDMGIGKTVQSVEALKKIEAVQDIQFGEVEDL